jgi:hypothetical protein
MYDPVTTNEMKTIYIFPHVVRKMPAQHSPGPVQSDFDIRFFQHQHLGGFSYRKILHFSQYKYNPVFFGQPDNSGF